MKCDACHREVALAKVCPYCGAKVTTSPEPRSGERAEKSRPRGEFKGPVDSRAKGSSPAAPVIPRILRFFIDPRVPGWRKGLIMGTVFYILSPIDFLPGAVFPIVGWFDDAAVLALAWRWINSELRRLDS